MAYLSFSSASVINLLINQKALHLYLMFLRIISQENSVSAFLLEKKLNEGRITAIISKKDCTNSGHLTADWTGETCTGI